MIMIPPGFAARPLTLEDAPACADIMNAITASLGIDEGVQAESLRLEWQEPGFDLARSSLGIVDDKGALAGFATFWATAEIPVRPSFGWAVRPAYFEAELERYLLRWVENKGAEVIDRCPPDARIGLRSGLHEGYRFGENALAAGGFALCRTFYDMEIALRARPAPPVFPAGIYLRQYQTEDDLPLLVDTIRDSFSDHFGYLEEPFEKDLQVFRHWVQNNPHFDPDLVHLAVAEATGQVVGCLIGLTQDYRQAEAGFIDTVGVRRAFRRRGLATALLQHSFAQFWDRGKRSVRLDVDGENLTNAVALYERVGMRIFRRYVVYEKVLRDGVELAKMALD